MVAWIRYAEKPQPSVLITDDNDGWREIVEDILRRVGFHTLAATCGEEAIELVQTEHLDVVLMDFHMPQMNGLETLRIIRRHAETLPAVLMTGRPEDLPPQEVEALRVETILEKTADRQHIVTTVTKIVRWP